MVIKHRTSKVRRVKVEQKAHLLSKEKRNQLVTEKLSSNCYSKLSSSNDDSWGHDFTSL